MQKNSAYIRTNDNVRLYYEEAGSGKDVVLIPGAGASMAWWQRNFAVLAEQFHVVAVDMRSTGNSDHCDWGHNCARYAMDVHQLIHALGMHDVTLVGWSCGARTCYSYLMLFGNHRLRGVVVVDDTVHHTVHDPTPEEFIKQADESDEAYMRRFMRLMVAPENPEAVTEEEVDWMTAAFSKTHESLGADGQAQDWRPLCPVIDLPVLITSGAHSGALPGCRYAAEHIPGARLEIFAHSGHGLFYTEAEKFNRLVADFVINPVALGRQAL
jgi:non-heme chloroperoxidase